MDSGLYSCAMKYELPESGGIPARDSSKQQSGSGQGWKKVLTEGASYDDYQCYDLIFPM